MVIDTSALAAILFDEPERAELLDRIAGDETRMISAATLLEVSIVVEGRKGRRALRELDRFLLQAQVRIMPFDGEQAELAREAYQRFGKGRHRAGLNFGDCFAYALAKSLAQPLLYKGTDFADTDLARA